MNLKEQLISELLCQNEIDQEEIKKLETHISNETKGTFKEELYNEKKKLEQQIAQRNELLSKYR